MTRAGSDSAPPAPDLGRADAACDRFEAEWAAGRRPRIEDLVAGEDGPTRDHLLRELVLLEFECRQTRGETPTADEYARRFPGLPPDWLDRSLTPDRSESDAVGSDRFRLLSRLGAGTYGVVWRAHDALLGRVVALKVPHPALAASREVRERFRREARAAARLRHPNIVPVHGAAEFHGLPALVSDYAGGEPLTLALRRRRFSPKEAAALAAELADALDYAHAMGAVHRDVKPGNILLAPAAPGAGSSTVALSDIGRPQLVDFGLALGETGEVTLTADGQLVGTPAYMSPEQAAGRGHRVDRRSDVYSTGVVLYEMLTGRPPFDGACEVLLDRVRSAEPARPRSLDRQVPRDLETVCLKAMEKEPARRYQTARAMAEDLRRWLRGEPILARSPRPWERAYRWARRRPALAGLFATTGVAALAVAVAGVAMRYNARLAQARGVAETNLYFHRLALASREWAAGNVGRVEQLLDECPTELRGWEWRYLRKQCRGFLGGFAHDAGDERAAAFPLVSVAYAPDGRTVVSVGGRSESVKLWDAADGRLLRQLPVPPNGASAVSFRPDGQALAVGGFDGSVRLWEVSTGRELRSWTVPGAAVYSVAFSPDGGRVAAGFGAIYWATDDPARSGVYVWDVASGAELHRLTGHRRRVTAVAFRPPDGRELASADGAWFHRVKGPAGPSPIHLWNVDSGRPVRTLEGVTGPVAGLAWDSGGRRLASAGWDGQIIVFEPDAGPGMLRIAAHPVWVRGIAFSPDGRLLATGGSDGALRLWDASDGTPVQALRGHTQAVMAVSYRPDGREIATAGSDGLVKYWDPNARPEVVTVRPFSHEVAALGFPSGAGAAKRPVSALVAVATAPLPEGGKALSAKILDPDTGSELESHQLFPGVRDRAAISPDGRSFACTEGANVVRVIDAGGWERWSRPMPESHVRQVLFSPDGRTVFAIGGHQTGTDGTLLAESLRAWAADSGRELSAAVGRHRSTITRAAVSPDGRLLAVGSGRVVTLWNTDPLTPRSTFTAHDRAIEALAFSGDGARLATAGRDLIAKVWEVSGFLTDIPKPLLVLRGHVRNLTGVAWSPDDRRIATCAEDQTVRLWDAAVGQEALMLRTDGDLPVRVVWSPDGCRLVAGDRAGIVHIWEALP